MSPTSTPNQPRQHKGVPAGGQWRSVPKPEGPPLLGPGEGTAPAGATEQPDERLVRARDVLLAGLNALGPQREALTVVGAQAVFEHTRGRNDISLTLTVDGDTSVAPALACDLTTRWRWEWLRGTPGCSVYRWARRPGAHAAGEPVPACGLCGR